MGCLRSIDSVSLLDRIPNTRIRLLCNSQPCIEARIRLHRLRWLGHIARMPPQRLCHSIWRATRPPTWRCIPSASKLTWDKATSSDLSELRKAYKSVPFSHQIIVDVAQDRAQWRRIIRLGQATSDDNLPP